MTTYTTCTKSKFNYTAGHRLWILLHILSTAPLLTGLFPVGKFQELKSYNTYIPESVSWILLHRIDICYNLNIYIPVGIPFKIFVEHYLFNNSRCRQCFVKTTTGGGKKPPPPPLPPFSFMQFGYNWLNSSPGNKNICHLINWRMCGRVCIRSFGRQPRTSRRRQIKYPGPWEETILKKVLHNQTWALLLGIFLFLLFLKF